MPGTPPTSPRFSIPRYADSDVASFSAQVNPITDGFDAAVARRTVPNVLSGSATGADHQIIMAPPSAVVTLPTPSSEHEMVCVYAEETVTGATPVTVQYGGGGGGKIYGKGLAAGVTSFLLGMPGSFAWLFSYDGTNWRIVQGEQDTGWVALSLNSNFGPGSGFTPGVRLMGDILRVRGEPTNSSGTTLSGGTIGSFGVQFPSVSGSPFFPSLIGSQESGASVYLSVRSVNLGSFTGAGLPNGQSIGLDGISTPVS